MLRVPSQLWLLRPLEFFFKNLKRVGIHLKCPALLVIGLYFNGKLLIQDLGFLEFCLTDNIYEFKNIKYLSIL